MQTNSKRDADKIGHPQRTTSLGSTDSNPSSVISYNSGGLVYFFSEPVQAFESLQDKVSAIRRTSGPLRSVSLHLSEPPLASEPLPSSTPSVDLFQLPASSDAPWMDLFQPCVLFSAPSLTENQPSRTSQPSCLICGFFSAAGCVPKYERWATFDLPQCTVSTAQILDMSSLQTALPDVQLLPNFHRGIAEPWLPQNTVTPYISSTG